MRTESPDGAAAEETVKLFVGQIPRQMNEEQLLPIFQEAGSVQEISIIKDRTTKESRGCCFLVYSTKEEADNAIDLFHNKRKLPPMSTPMQVKYADGELERLEHKLFIGMLPKSVSESDITAVFSPFGTIKELTIIKASQAAKGCAFLKLETREQATAAIKALNGTHKMEGASSALVVKWADTEREREARKAQKTPAMPTIASGAMPVQQPSVYGGVPSGYAVPSPLNGYGYQAPSAYEMHPYSATFANQPGISAGILGASGSLHGAGFDLSSGTASILGTSFGATPPSGYMSSAYSSLPGAQYSAFYQGSLLGQTAVTPIYQGTGLNASFATTAPVRATSGPQLEGPQGANLFIYHLPAEFGDQELFARFQPFGNVISAKVFVDKITGLSKCFGFVSYDSPNAAQAAISAMNGSQLAGKRLKVQLKRDSRQSMPY